MPPLVNQAMQAPSQVYRRYDNRIGSLRGKTYFIAPGTSAISVGGRTVNPSSLNDGLSPYTPFSNINSFAAVVAPGDTGVLMEKGVYTLTANLVITVNEWKLTGLPEFNVGEIEIAGIAGGHAMSIEGRDVAMENLSMASGDAGFASLEVRGRHFRAKRCQFTNESVIPAAGLKLNPKASGSSTNASFAEIEDCWFDNNVVGLLFGFTAGDFPGSTDCMIRNCRFRLNSTAGIGQEASNAINSIDIHDCKFTGTVGTDWIKLDNVANGASDINTIMGCSFADDDVSASGTVDLTAGGFKVVGCYEVAGIIADL